MKFTQFIVILAIIGIGFSQSVRIETNYPKEAEALLTHKGDVEFTDAVNASTYNIEGNFSIKTNSLPIPIGTTLYALVEQHQVELTICENEKYAQNKTVKILQKIFSSQEVIDGLLEGGYHFKTKTENCQGYILNITLHFDVIENLADFVHRELLKVFPFELGKTYRFMKPTTQTSFKLAVDVETEFYFKSFPVKFQGLERLLSKNDKISHKNKDSTLTVEYRDRSVAVDIVKRQPEDITIHPQLNTVFKIEGAGLHREMHKTIYTNQIDNKMFDFGEYQNQDCNFIFVDPVSEETYIDQDEMRKLPYMEFKRFEVFNIEIPTFIAKQYIWISKISLKDFLKISDRSEYLNMKYQVHFRYTDPADVPLISQPFFLKTRAFTNCTFKNKFKSDQYDHYFYQDKIESLYGPGYQKIKMKHYPSFEHAQNNTGSDIAFYPIPAGQIALKDTMLYASITLSIIVAGYLFVVLLKANPKTKVN